MGRLRHLRHPHHLRFHPTWRIASERQFSHSHRSRVGLFSSSRYYAAPHSSWAGQLNALRATLYSMPAHQPHGPFLSEIPLFRHDPDRATTFIPDNSSTDDVYHLGHAGTRPNSLSTTPTLVDVNLVHQSGAPAFTWSYMVNIFPRKDAASGTATDRTPLRRHRA